MVSQPRRGPTTPPGGAGARDADLARREIFKALGDNTRYAIYLELARSPSPRSTADVADALGLHVNTVRSHLEHMREVGLLELHVEASGGVGRPQHRYALAPDAPSLGLEPPVLPLLARMLLRLAADAGLVAGDASDAGRDEGRHLARSHRGDDPVSAVCAMSAGLGFDPAAVTSDDTTTVAFTHCPFADLAAGSPDLVCGLHHGLVAGFCESLGSCRVTDFRPLTDRRPCQVDLVAA